MSSTKPVRIDGEIVEAAEQTAREQHRSTAEQVNRWVRLGKHLDLSISVDQRHIEQVVAGKDQFKDLTTEERTIAHARIDAAIDEAVEETNLGRRARDGGVTTVTMDDQGRVIETTPDGEVRVLAENAPRDTA